jgi:hypothetical protein
VKDNMVRVISKLGIVLVSLDIKGVFLTSDQKEKGNF